MLYCFKDGLLIFHKHKKDLQMGLNKSKNNENKKVPLFITLVLMESMRGHFEIP